MPSAEHTFVSSQLDASLMRFASTRLYGVTEAERKTFDYACILQRDYSRPLVSQTLWSHTEGIDKDLRTLLHDSEAALKVYLFKDSVRHRVRIEEVIKSYRTSEDLKKYLLGLRLFPLPADFDADKERDQRWMQKHLEDRILEDLLFAVIFGMITAHDFITFLRTGGIVGEKQHLLAVSIKFTGEITSQNDVARAMGHWQRKASQSLIRAMRVFNALGIIDAQYEQRRFHFRPTTKGRLLYDLLCLLWYELQQLDDWSGETRLILEKLGQPNTPFVPLYRDRDLRPSNLLLANLKDFVFENPCFRDEPLEFSAGVRPTFYSLNSSGILTLSEEERED